VALVFAWVGAPPAGAEMFGQDFKPCGDMPSTMEIVACTAAKTRMWDERMNTAYRSLMQRVDAGQRNPLVAAQRLWVQFRDANCRFYGSQEGSISRIQAADCVRAMTEARAIELENAIKLN
jgi:uncharacterized protein YecT (DUF1311 family)